MRLPDGFVRSSVRSSGCGWRATFWRLARWAWPRRAQTWRPATRQQAQSPLLCYGSDGTRRPGILGRRSPGGRRSGPTPRVGGGGGGRVRFGRRRCCGGPVGRRPANRHAGRHLPPPASSRPLRIKKKARPGNVPPASASAAPMGGEARWAPAPPATKMHAWQQVTLVRKDLSEMHRPRCTQEEINSVRMHAAPTDPAVAPAVPNEDPPSSLTPPLRWWSPT